MTPLETLIQAVGRANTERPDLAQTNTIASCMELNRLTARYAGPEFAFIGKTSSLDGGMAHPAWFTPVVMTLTRPDGQSQSVVIDGLSMDALWHLPTMTQFKVIVNSTANELPPDDPRRGPARLTPYAIDAFKDGQRQYRWHNPPIPQAGTPQPVPPPAPTIPPFPPRDETFRFALGRLNQFYADKGRSVEMMFHDVAIHVDFEGQVIWVSEYLRRRQLGESDADAAANVLKDVAAAWR